MTSNHSSDLLPALAAIGSYRIPAYVCVCAGYDACLLEPNLLLRVKSCLAHDFAATFALLELILKLKTSNGAGVPQKPNPTDLLMYC